MPNLLNNINTKTEGCYKISHSDKAWILVSKKKSYDYHNFQGEIFVIISMKTSTQCSEGSREYSYAYNKMLMIYWFRGNKLNR